MPKSEAVSGHWSEVFERCGTETALFLVRGSASTRDAGMHDGLRVALDHLSPAGETELVEPSMGASPDFEVARYAFLDGGVLSCVGDPDMEVPTGTFVLGFDALRLLVDDMQLVPPRRLLGEPSIRSIEALREEFSKRDTPPRPEVDQARVDLMEGHLTGTDFTEMERAIAIEATLDRHCPGGVVVRSANFGAEVAALDGSGPVAIPVSAWILREPDSHHCQRLLSRVTDRLKRSVGKAVVVVFGDQSRWRDAQSGIEQLKATDGRVAVARWASPDDTNIAELFHDQ